MTNTTYSNALAETLFIIKCLPSEKQNKIPKEFIDYLISKKNNDYLVKINPNINLYNQPLLNETKMLLKEIYINYFTSQNERNRIRTQDNFIEKLDETLKSKKHDYNSMLNRKRLSVPNDTSPTPPMEIL